VPLQIQAGSDGTAAVLLSDAEDQRDNLGWNAKTDVVRSSGLVPKTRNSMLLITFLPNVEQRPGSPKKR